MKKIVIALSALLVSFSGCNFLDLVPEDDIETIETIFEKREQAELWLKTCYTFLWELGGIPRDPSFTGTDEVVGGDFIRQNGGGGGAAGFAISDGLQMSQEPWGNAWRTDGFFACLRYCNIFIENIDKVYNMPDTEKRQWTAEIKALKAYVYYQLILRYGPIILVPQNIDVTEPTSVMQQPRSHIDDCFQAIVDLLDEAMVDLLPFKSKDMSRWTYFNLEAAAALKAKALILAASPLFNGNPAYANFKNRNGELLFNDTPDPEKWKLAAEAADEAISICESFGKTLVKGSMTKSTKLLNQMQDIEKSTLAYAYQNDEALYMIRHLYDTDFWAYFTLPNIDATKDYDQANARIVGSISPSMKMVEMYYTDHGLPIDEDKEWDYANRYQMGRELNAEYRDVVPVNSDNILKLHLRREPRFYAHIAADRCYWQRGENVWNLMQVMPYRGELFGTDQTTINSGTSQNLTGYYMKKGTYSDVTAANYSSVSGREEAIIMMRLAELYLIKAEAWNEYEGPSREKVYEPLNVIRSRAGIPDIETAWNTYAKNPSKITNKQAMRDIIRQEWNIEFAFEGQRFWNVRRWMTAHEELNEKQYGWNVLGDNAASFYNNFTEPIVVWSKRGFQAPRDYLFPLRAEEVLISGTKQNPGW